MAQRTVALCDGKYIGIETIYTVINGRQINISEKLKELRAKSQRNELFCPCGCGTNLILVAGDKNLREQHFREKPGTGTYECNMPTEGKTSVDSKIVLKCWLDDKLKADDIDSRVPIDTIEDIKRKPEFTFLSMDKKFAIRYWRTRANVLDDKLDVLAGNLSGIKVVYIVDASNGGTEGQYPEALMKLQDRQKFCLLLSVQEAEYDKALLKAVFYDKDLDGLWKEVVFAEGSLRGFSIVDNNIILGENTLEQLLAEAKIGFSNDQQVEKERRAEQERLRAEHVRKMQEEDERRRQEILRQREEAEKKLQQQKEEAEKRRKEFEEKRRIEVERQQEEQRQREEDFKRNMQSNFSQQETQVRDAAGNRWIKCEFCGKIAMENEFNSYGGAGHINLGTCKECSANNPAVKQKAEEQTAKLRGKYDPNVCPECGGRLRERSEPYGRLSNDYDICYNRYVIYGIGGSFYMAYIVGLDRNQTRMITTSLDDLIDKDNSVRVIDAYVESLDLHELGFIEYSGSNRGQSPYRRSDLLKLHIYGYLNKIRSSRALEIEAKRNIELMWLINSITPDHGTIAGFVQKNKAAFHNTLRNLTLILKGWGLIDGNLVAIDGTKIKAQNSKHNCITQSGLDKKIEYAEAQINAYLMAIEKDDAATDDFKEKIQSYQNLKEQYLLQK